MFVEDHPQIYEHQIMIFVMTFYCGNLNTYIEIIKL